MQRSSPSPSIRAISICANTIWKQLVNDYEKPPLDPGINEALDAFVFKRKAEGGAPIN